MQFEVIRKSHKKEIIIGVIVFVIIAIVLIVHQSFAKYRTVKKFTILEGTITYTPYDYRIRYINIAGDVYTCDPTINECKDMIKYIPSNGYKLVNTSYCETKNDLGLYIKDNNINLSYQNGQVIISASKKKAKCYLYFEKNSAKDKILASIIPKNETPDFSKIATTDEGVFKAKDDDGDTYYWRGAVTNNYVKFANKYWRIIRINGDGSVRLIYDGTSIHNNGISTSDSIAVASKAFNSSYNNNMYVGFKYTSGEVHGTGTKSTILESLETWYTSNLSSYASKIDTNAGFCGDRTPSTSDKLIDNKGGTGITTTYYGAYVRLKTNRAPVLTCPTEDLYTVSGASKGNKSLIYPIGLITADEVAMAGSIYGTTNKNYYLYTGQVYWTMSPSHYGSSVFFVNQDGDLAFWTVHVMHGVRPVINLRSDITLTGKGTASDPYVVQ